MRITEEFQRIFGRRPEIVVRAPGRVNLLGAHVDYNDGWVMPAAIDRTVQLAAAAGTGRTLQVRALDLDAAAEVDLDHLPPPVPERGDGGSEWSDYPTGVAWALREAGHDPQAMDVAFTSDVPMGAGVGSSAAVEVAFLLAWRELSGLPLDGTDVPRLGRRAENGYLGVQSGIMDQFASLHGAAGQAIFLDCRDLSFEPLPFPGATTVVVADSGVRRRLARAETGYNDRPAECHQAMARLRPCLPEIHALRDLTEEDYERHSHHLPMALRRRVRHVVDECRRVRDGAEALRRGDVEAFGALVRRSHLSSRDLYEISIPELDVLAASAWSVEGCHGARMTGGGFGGCVAAVVADAAVGDVLQAMTAAFEAKFGRRPDVFTCRVAAGATVLAPGED
jgi:galactokinase